MRPTSTRRHAIRITFGFGALCAAASAAAAPDEVAYGSLQGYPPGNRTTWFRQEHLVGAFSAMEQLFPVHTVATGHDARPLPRSASAVDWPFVQPYLDSHPATGLLVMKDGQVLLERYQYGRSAEHRFTSFSMAKTVVAMALGVAVAEGRIASLDDPVERYEPALADTAWQGVTVRHVLNMASGVHFDETYDRADSDIAKLSRAWTRQGSLLGELQTFKVREAAPGQRFKYISADTQVLAQVVAGATGRRLAEYVSEKIWAPMGAEADAAWTVDGKGVEAAYCCLSARLRDWARLGQLLLDRGQRDGKAIIPAQWIDAATTVRPADGYLRPQSATPYFGYGYQTWIFPDQLGFALLGVRGQAVFVHPKLKLVMVQTAVWPRSTDPTLSRQRDRFWRDVVKAAAAM